MKLSVVCARQARASAARQYRNVIRLARSRIATVSSTLRPKVHAYRNNLIVANDGAVQESRCLVKPNLWCANRLL